MDFGLNIIPLEQMERLESKFKIQLHLIQEAAHTRYLYRKNDKEEWKYLGDSIMECGLKLSRLQKEGKL